MQIYCDSNNNFNFPNRTLGEMSNLANYSPYNKTYKFIMFQNQAYHEKNKKNAMPCIRSNLRYGPKNTPASSNP